VGDRCARRRPKIAGLAKHPVKFTSIPRAV
jgi:hypothetical protein